LARQERPQASTTHFSASWRWSICRDRRR